MAKVKVNTLVGNNASVANVKVDVGSFSGSFTAESKKHPKDEPLASVGEALALSRALAKVAADLEQWANSEVSRQAHRQFVQDTHANSLKRALYTDYPKY